MTNEARAAPRSEGLAGKRVLVTAGAGGIGLAIVRRLTNSGARVFVCDVDEPALARLEEEFPEIGRSTADVSDERAVDNLFAAIRDKFSGLDALVNNAGVAGPTGGVDEISVADWRRCVDVCLTGQFLCARLATPLLKSAGGGSIVNMSSAAGRFGYAYRTPYSAAKFGVIGLTQSLAKELGPHNIRVNALLPGIVAGARMDGVIRSRAAQLNLSFEEMKREYLSRVSMRTMVTAEDVAEMTAFLLSDAGRYISGQSIGVDGNVEAL